MFNSHQDTDKGLTPVQPDRESQPDTQAAAPPSVRVCGRRIHCVDRVAALQLLAAFLREERPHQVVTADASMLVIAETDRVLQSILEHADLVVPDSIGVIWASRVLGDPLKERVSGVDLVEPLCKCSRDAGLRVFLLGAAPGVAQKAGDRLQALYPGLVIAGTHHGYFSQDEEAQVVEMVALAHPDVLVAAMGIPRQEKWLYRYLPELPARVGIGVGGALDVLAGEVKRAPVFFQQANLEWLYRVLREPRRYRKTLMLPRFVWLTLRCWLARIRQK